MDTPHTLQAAIVFFSDADRCFQYALKLRWPDSVVTCPRCAGEKHSFIKTRRIWFCAGCKKQFTIKVGTIFEDSPIGLDKWMVAMWLLANSKNGISSYELHRAIGVTQKSAWFILHRIRETMKQNPKHTMGSHWGNPIEVDEAFIGGKIKNMHRNKAMAIRENAPIDRMEGYGTNLKNKIPVMGMLNRETREVRAKVVPNVKRETLQNEILKNVGFNAHVFTDQAVGYDNLDKVKNFTHRTVNHVTQYVNGRVHTNGIENFWSLLKRGLNGTYVAVEPFHLDRYVDEQVFRFNNRRDMDDQDRFEKCMGNVAGKRLTYAELTGAGSATAL
jgi:transposase-like protein